MFDEIDGARPHFIGVLANRCGYIPEKEEVDKIENVDDDLKKKWRDGKYSLMHMEMDYDVLVGPEGGYSHFYFKSKKASTNYDANPEHIKNSRILKVMSGERVFDGAEVMRSFRRFRSSGNR